MSDDSLSPELVQDVIAAVRRRIAVDRRRAAPDVAAILVVVEERLDDPELYAMDLRALAREADTLFRFRLQLGLDVDAYLDHARLEIAYGLVTGGDARVVEIAAALGFPDAEMFSKWFKRRTGHSPEKLREKSLREESPETDREKSPLTAQAERSDELTFHDWQRAVVEVLESGKLDELIRLGVESYPEVAREIPALESVVRLRTGLHRSRGKQQPPEQE